MSDQAARERDALFGATSRQLPEASRARIEHDPQFQEPLKSGQEVRGGFDGSTYAWSRMTGPQQQQQQREHLSWAEVQKKVDVAERQRGLRSTYESVEVGRETLEHLEDQKEKLERSEMVLDSTRYALDRSARVLRGMNFWGRIRNAFSDDPQIPQSYRNSSTDVATLAIAVDADTPLEGFICPDCWRRFTSSGALVEHFGSHHVDNVGDSDEGEQTTVEASGAVAASRGDARASNVYRGQGEAEHEKAAASGSLRDQLFGERAEVEVGATAYDDNRVGGVGREREGGRIIAEQKAVMTAQNDYIDSVGRAVSELGLLGRNIGASIDAQGVTLERVLEKTEETDDRAAFVTRKAARLAQSSKSKKPTFVMSVALQEVSSGQFLTAIGEDVVLQETELRNVCRFEAWQRQEGIIGLKSGVTRRWLGQTWLGHLRVSGSSFGKTYEWQANLMRSETTMVCCSANWGAGGYLSVLPGAKDGNTRDSPTSMTPAAARSRDTTRSYPTPPERITASSDRHSSLASSLVYDRLKLTLVDATPANRTRAAVFRVVNCDGYTPQPFVGGRLMRNPTEPDRRRGDGGGSDVRSIRGAS